MKAQSKLLFVSLLSSMVLGASPSFAGSIGEGTEGGGGGNGSPFEVASTAQIQNSISKVKVVAEAFLKSWYEISESDADPYFQRAEAKAVEHAGNPEVDQIIIAEYSRAKREKAKIVDRIKMRREMFGSNLTVVLSKLQLPIKVQNNACSLITGGKTVQKDATFSAQSESVCFSVSRLSAHRYSSGDVDAAILALYLHELAHANGLNDSLESERKLERFQSSIQNFLKSHNYSLDNVRNYLSLAKDKTNEAVVSSISILETLIHNVINTSTCINIATESNEGGKILEHLDRGSESLGFGWTHESNGIKSELFAAQMKRLNAQGVCDQNMAEQTARYFLDHQQIFMDKFGRVVDQSYPELLARLKIRQIQIGDVETAATEVREAFELQNSALEKINALMEKVK